MRKSFLPLMVFLAGLGAAIIAVAPFSCSCDGGDEEKTSCPIGQVLVNGKCVPAGDRDVDQDVDRDPDPNADRDRPDRTEGQPSEQEELVSRSFSLSFGRSILLLTSQAIFYLQH